MASSLVDKARFVLRIDKAKKNHATLFFLSQPKVGGVFGPVFTTRLSASLVQMRQSVMLLGSVLRGALDD